MRVIILAKAPVAGHVKTRLMPEYSAKEAAELHRLMVEAVLGKVCGLFDDIWLAVDDMRHPFFTHLAQTFPVHLCEQGKGSLGDRLIYLCKLSFQDKVVPVMFLGTDSPHVQLERYHEVARAIHKHDVVIGPVEDGGYDLIAMRKPVCDVFEHIHWDSSSVFEDTLQHIHRLQLSVAVLSVSFDLDRPEDIKRAPPETWI